MQQWKHLKISTLFIKEGKNSMDLPKVKTRSKKRLGRGYGSGKGGHTASRGQKGQKSRSKLHLLFEGVKVKKSLIRRLPLQRGKARNAARPKPITITTDQLNVFKSGDKVNFESLVKNSLVDIKDISKGVKILSGGKLEKKLSVEVPASASAGKIIEKAGGTLK